MKDNLHVQNITKRKIITCVTVFFRTSTNRWPSLAAKLMDVMRIIQITTRLCRSPDSTHLSSKCATGIMLYHGTKVSNVSSISLSGLRVSATGRLGRGVYMTNCQQMAELISVKHASAGVGTGSAVVRIWVNLGNCYNNGTADDQAGSW